MRTLAALTLGVILSCSASRPMHVSEDDRPLPTLSFNPSAGHRVRVAVIKFHTPVKTAEAITFRYLLEVAQEADEIVVVLTSLGGDPSEAAQMVVDITKSKPKVTCVAREVVASAAFIILQGCPTRLMESNALLMVHDAVFTSPPKPGDTRQAKVLESINKAVAVLVCRKLHFPTVEACRARYSNSDWWIGRAEAVEVGAVDGVVPSYELVVDKLRQKEAVIE